MSETKTTPQTWTFGEREWQPAGAQQEIVDGDGETVGWIECYQGDEANARIACAAPLFAAACTPTAPDEPDPLEALQQLLADLTEGNWPAFAPDSEEAFTAMAAAGVLLAGLRAAVRAAKGEGS
jgi:hypothetical protein